MSEAEEVLKAQRGTRLHWRDVLLVSTSAVLSGIAVVIWNRRSLQRLRQVDVSEAEDQSRPADREFI